MRTKKTIYIARQEVIDAMVFNRHMFEHGRISESKYRWEKNFLEGKMAAYNFVLGNRKDRKDPLALLDNANEIHP